LNFYSYCESTTVFLPSCLADLTIKLLVASIITLTLTARGSPPSTSS
jgi:hypothetical protein